jgi:zinc finger protein
MAFECQHCGFRNSEVQMGGMIPEKGVRFELRVEKGDTKASAVRESSSQRLSQPPFLSLSTAKWSRETRAPAR